MYTALLDPRATEALKNCLVYNTTVEAVYLSGDFGVYGAFNRGKRMDVIIGKNFYLSQRKTQVQNLITDGYPFFAGEIDLVQEVDLPSADYVLQSDARFHAVRVWVNEQYAGDLFFKNTLDLRAFLRAGKNRIRLRVSVSNRNLLGPHHLCEEDSGSASPGMFERFGTWTKGNRPLFIDTYAFVKDWI